MLDDVMRLLEERMREEYGLDPEARIHQVVAVDEVQLLAEDAATLGVADMGAACTRALNSWMPGEPLC